MSTPRPVGNDKIYDLVDQARRELKSDILRLEAKFDALEAGRLTRAEADIGQLKVKEATLNTKVYVLVFVISSTISAIITAISVKVIK